MDVRRKRYRILIIIQSSYFFLTALWALVDIESFMWVTGPKTDTWLVKTVAAMLLPVSITLALYARIQTDYRPAITLGLSSALAFFGIDTFYSVSGVISPIYLADAVIQFVFIVWWIQLFRPRLA